MSPEALSPGVDLASTPAQWLEHMKAGRFAEAWAVSDHILRNEGTNQTPLVPRHHQRVWAGGDVTGQRVLVRCYHGLGDTIQFVRYMPLLRTRAREVVVWAQPALLPLLTRMPGIDRLLPLHDGVPDVRYDVDVEIMELPHVFRTTLDTIPRQIPYLDVDAPAKPPTDRRRIMLVTRGGGWDTARHIPPEVATPLFSVPRTEWHALDECSSLLDVARTLRGMDLVISVDTMAAHLAGALGVPTWILLHPRPDWRWFDGRDDSPWYPTARLFRRSHAEGWEATIERVCAALA